jgi:hypothetical protein
VAYKQRILHIAPCGRTRREDIVGPAHVPI